MRVEDGRAVTNFIAQALRGDDITIYGDGSQTRSFCYVTDLVDGIIAFRNSDFIGPVNLGNPTEMTIAELAHTIVSLTGSKSAIVHKDLPVDDPKQRRPDISLAKEKFGWEPKVTLAEGLAKVIDRYRERLSGK
jgi:UDP-glucuronate decarboxylase